MPKRRNPAAPVAPPRPAPSPVRPAPSPSRPEPARPDPLNPTKPSTMPRPKLSFWADIPPEHGFYGHPVLHTLGEELSDAAFAEISKHVEPGEAASDAAHAASVIRQHESGHEDELTDLARSIVESVWGMTPDRMKGGIGSVSEDVDQMDFESQESEQRTLWDLSPEQLSQVQKRLLMNTIIQGAAIHAMLNNPRMIQADLKRIHPALLNLYESFSWNALALYWDMPYEGMGAGQIALNSAGYEHVKFEQREGRESAVVYAVGMNFPVMLQEFVKGVAEVICINGLNRLDPETLQITVELADLLVYEPYQIMIGPEIWRRLLRSIRRDESLTEYMARMSMMEPDELSDFVVKSINARRP